MWKMILFEMVGMLAVLYIAVGSVSGFLYIPILVILLSVFVVVGGKHGLKGVGVSILVFIVSLVMFNAYYNFTCGPNSADVKVMKPMAEKISTYIVKHGIPESLKDIPNLPYGLEGCVRESYYDKFDKKTLNYIKIPSKKGADSRVIMQKCYFNYRSKKYTLNINGSYEFNYGGDFIMDIENDTSKTGIQYFFKIDKKGNTYIEHKGNPYSSKTNGICNPMKQ